MVCYSVFAADGMAFAENVRVMTMSGRSPKVFTRVLVGALVAHAAIATAASRPAELEPASIRIVSGASTSAHGSDVAEVLRLRMYGKTLVLGLEDSGILAPNLRDVEVGDGGVETPAESDVRHYRGYVDGEPGSWVRMSEANGQYSGLIQTGGEIFVIEPSDLWAHAVTNSNHVAYRLADVAIDPAISCGVGESSIGSSVVRRHARRSTDGRRAGSDTTSSSSAPAAALQGTAGGFLNTEISLVGDYEYFANANWPAGHTASSWMQAVVNAMSGIYENELGISFVITTSTVYTTVNDPFAVTPTGNGCQTGRYATNVLSEFSSTRSSGSYPWSLANSDVAHLFTGRPLCSAGNPDNPSVIGIAWYDGICQNYYGTGISRSYTTNIGSMSVLAAHEVGHNFNAPHVSNGNCNPHSCCVMLPSIGGCSPQNRFSSASITTIANYAAGRSCLSSGPPPDTPTPSHTPTPTHTATQTRTPTVTRTATITRTATRTLTPSSTPTPTPVNVAQGAAATQSSTVAGGVASRAVDGNTNGNFSANSVTHTDVGVPSWWEVDLGQQYDISSIRVWNRTDCCGERLSNYYVLVSNGPAPQPGQGAAFERLETAPAGSPTTLAVNAVGRYVRIQKVGSGVVALAEVQVFGVPVVVTNLALGAPATQSSTAAGGVASRAVDGSTNGAWSGGSVTHTNVGDPSWWEVDLGGLKQVDTVAVWNRTDCCGDRLSNYYVLLSANPNPLPGGAGVATVFQAAQAGSPSLIGVDAVGRYLRIQKMGSGLVSLAEVQVFGSAVSVSSFNVAQGRPASQSSTAAGGVAARAVDGNTNGNWGGASVTHTFVDDPAWWEVDLEEARTIDSIEIWNRTDCCGERLSNYYVLVSNSPNPQPGQGGIFEQFLTGQAGSPTSIPVNASGRYVRVQKLEAGLVSLAEVRVIGN